MGIIQFDRYPLNATLELTARCNLRCKMCLIRIDKNRMTELGGRERTTKEWIRMAQEIKEAGALGILLTGGEPMLRRDFPQLYREIARMGFVVALYTNATLVTPEIMEVLREYPPHTIGITAYGACAATYEAVTGDGNAYYKMLEGVEQLRKLPSNMSIRTTIIKDNLGDLDDIIQWVAGFDKAVEFTVARIVTKQVRGGIADVEGCRLTPEQNVSLQEKMNREFIVSPIREYFSETIAEEEERAALLGLLEPMTVEGQGRYSGNSGSKDDITLYGCDAGIQSFTITWDGKLIGCQLLGDCWTYPFEVGFDRAWMELPEQIRLPELPKECQGCTTSCCACPATRLAETGSLGGCPEYICKESKLKERMHKEMLGQVKKIIKRKEASYESV